MQNIQAVPVESPRLKLSALGGLSNGASAFKSMSWTNPYTVTSLHNLPHMLTDKGDTRLLLVNPDN